MQLGFSPCYIFQQSQHVKIKHIVEVYQVVFTKELVITLIE